MAHDWQMIGKENVQRKYLIMKWLETIELRTANIKDLELQNVFNQLVHELKLDAEYPSISVYKNYAINCDFSIHLVHQHLQPDEEGSSVGIRIASILKTFGLVSHNTWIEQKDKLRQAQQ